MFELGVSKRSLMLSRLNKKLLHAPLRNHNVSVPAQVLDGKVVSLHASFDFLDLSGCLKTQAYYQTDDEILQAGIAF
jgi:hypothetical protein